VLAKFLEKKNTRHLILSGILFGLSALTRPVSLPLPFLAFLLLWLNEQKLMALSKLLTAARYTSVLVIAMLLTIAPWSIRNWIVEENPTFITLNGGVNMYLAHNPKSQGYWVWMGEDDPVIKTQHTPEGKKLATQLALQYIREHPEETRKQFWKVHEMFWNKGDWDVDSLGVSVDRVLDQFFLPHIRFLDLKLLSPIGLLALIFRFRTASYLAVYIVVYNLIIDFLYFAPRYRMVIEPTRSWKEAVREPNFVLYDNRSAYSRYWLSPTADRPQVLDADAQIRETEYFNKELALEVSSSGGWLVLSQLFDPGWVAYVDGRKTRVQKIGESLTGVLIPAGSHHVRFRYEPQEWKLGLIGSGSGILLLGAWAFWSWRKRNL
jgi:hypothetical protein